MKLSNAEAKYKSLAFTALLPNKVEPSLGLALPTYTNPTIVPKETTIKKAHIQEIRDNIKAVE